MKRTGWGVAKIALFLYPFGAGATAVNVFFASLIGSWMGWQILSPLWSILWGLIIGLPATIAFAWHIRNLMDQSET